MNEADWLTTREPGGMLATLFQRGYHTRPDGPSAAGLRLFACACCRGIWDLLPDPRLQDAVEVAERYALGQCGDRDLRDAHEQASRALWRLGPGGHGYHAAQAACWASIPAASESAVVGMARHAAELSAGAWRQANPTPVPGPVCSWQADLLREIFGNPFRPAAIDPAWLAREDRAVARLAGIIHADGAFDTMPILADALEEAGCADQAILAHCRGAGGHVRGCWVLGLLLGEP
jgi:hypothetical protein